MPCKNNIFRKKKAQVWSLDIIVAVIIFLIGITVLYIYAVNYHSETRSGLEEMIYEGDLASKLILSDKDLGILSSGKVNQTKLEEFYALSYASQKSYLGIRNDFYFNMSGLEIQGDPKEYVGIREGADFENLVKITRLTVYKNKPVKFEVYIWS